MFSHYNCVGSSKTTTTLSTANFALLDEHFSFLQSFQFRENLNYRELCALMQSPPPLYQYIRALFSLVQSTYMLSYDTLLLFTKLQDIQPLGSQSFFVAFSQTEVGVRIRVLLDGPGSGRIRVLLVESRSLRIRVLLDRSGSGRIRSD